MRPRTIVIADDHAIMRQGLRRILEEAGYEITGEAEDGAKAVSLVDELSPEIVVMDIQMPVKDGISATRDIKASHAETSVVILTMHEEKEFVFEAVKAGAVGYLVKNRAPEELVTVIENARKGLSTLDPTMATKLLAEFDSLTAEKEDPKTIYEALTEREREVLAKLAKGLSNKEIAVELFISDKTVKNHVRNIFEKLHINDRTTAAVMAVRQGLVD